MTDAIKKLLSCGQAVWLSYPNLWDGIIPVKKLNESGEILGIMIDLQHSPAFDASNFPAGFLRDEYTLEGVFWGWFVQQVQSLCDEFYPIYDETSGAEGYVVVDIPPLAEYETDLHGSVVHFWGLVGRRNLMLRIPTSVGGVGVIRSLTSKGINTCCSPVFSVETYQAVVRSYIEGLEDCLLAGGDIESIHSVVEIFPARLGREVELSLSTYAGDRLNLAAAFAKVFYSEFLRQFTGVRFGKLQLGKGNFQRIMWLVQDDAAAVDVDALIGPATIVKFAINTIEMYRNDGAPKPSLLEAHQSVDAYLGRFSEENDALQEIGFRLEQEYLKEKSHRYQEIVESIRAFLLNGYPGQPTSPNFPD